MNLVEESKNDLINDFFEVENKAILDIMRKSAGYLEMDPDLMLKRYEDNYQKQIEQFKQTNLKFERDVKSEIDTVPRGMKRNHLDMS